MTRFEFWQESYLTSLRRLNAYRVGDEEKLTKHAARIADQAVTRFDEAAEQLALDEELEAINDETPDEDDESEEDEGRVKTTKPHVVGPTNIGPAQTR